jgi:hypothetical protein
MTVQYGEASAIIDAGESLAGKRVSEMQLRATGTVLSR